MARWVAEQAEAATAASDSKISRSRVVCACVGHFMAGRKLPKL
jgi:hypothetical protein